MNLKKWAKRGASLMIALMIFLLLALAGASALIMAMANSGRYSHKAEGQQPYYSVSSAALLMMNLLDGTQYKSKEVEYTYQRSWTGGEKDGIGDHTQEDGYTLNFLKKDTKGDYLLNSDKTEWQVDYDKIKGTMSTGEDKTLKDSKLLTEIGNWCDKLVPYLSIPQAWYSTLRNKSVGTDNLPTDPGILAEQFRPAPGYICVEFTVETTDETFGDVSARLIMYANYDILLSFSQKSELASGADGEASMYSVNIYWQAEVTEKTSSGAPVYEVNEDTDGDGEPDSSTSGSQTIKQTKRVTVVWDKENAVISRGEAVKPQDDEKKPQITTPSAA